MLLDSHTSLKAIRARVRYEPDTGHFYALKSAGRKKAGDRVGYADKLGYWKFAINGKWLMAHRVAWALMNGDRWPDGEIDHINGDPNDNRIVNLRVATRSQNVANAKFNSLNTTGYRGVCKHRGMFQAQVRKNGKLHYLGQFVTAEAAHAAYLAAAASVHGEFLPRDGMNVIEQPKPKPEQLSLLEPSP